MTVAAVAAPEDAADAGLHRSRTAACGLLGADPVGDGVDRLGELGASLLDLLRNRVRAARLSHVISFVGRRLLDLLTAHAGSLPSLQVHDHLDVVGSAVE